MVVATMNTWQEMKLDTRPVDSDLGIMSIDHEGSVVSGCRMEISKAYIGVPALLQKVIDNQDEGAWREIGTRIDYIGTNINIALTQLDKQTSFINKVKSDLKSGKKMLFKPNLVSPVAINYHSHDEGVGARICTDWTFLAALMRWFHDTLDISYHQMSMGEGSASCGLWAALSSKSLGKAITPEAVFEGKSGGLYGGWGFYFVRRYLSDRHPSSHTDNPMNGYEDSVAGRYVPPGLATDRLMVYDLNNISDDPKRGRTVPVKGGACYKDITLHKVIIGGDPGDRADMGEYPGSVMVNVPKLKIHLQDLITNATKNLGIGLYPMECSSGKPGDTKWLYATPDTAVPTLKSKLPHCRRIVLMDDNTHLPVINQKGEYSITMTPGMAGTQVDVIRATQDQGVFILHVVDAIDTINLSHDDETAVRVPEGFVWASLDCVALDLLCARYCFKTVPMKEGLALKEKNGWKTEFVRHVPVAQVEGTNIVTTGGYDSPLFRYNLFSYAESRDIGGQLYYVTGWDCVTGTPLVSLNGHLGRIERAVFKELMTSTLYYNPGCMLWDMQETLISYAKAHDKLLHSGGEFYQEFIDRFDENHDGIIDYDETGRLGYWSIGGIIAGYGYHAMISEPYGVIRVKFYIPVNLMLKPAEKKWNPQGHYYAQDFLLMNTATMAFSLSQSKVETPDDFIPGMVWGKGKWPSRDTAIHLLYLSVIYGSQVPQSIRLHLAYRSGFYASKIQEGRTDSGSPILESISLDSVYGSAFQYADKTLAGGTYTGSVDPLKTHPDSLVRYFNALSKGAAPLDFILYLPEGLGSINGMNIPNVGETRDNRKIFTASFNQGREIW